jgi:hypothetical protein
MPPDRYAIVAGDVQSHRDEVIALLQGNFERVPAADRYAKYYEGNPRGHAHFFLARDRETGAAVGLSALFATRLWVGGEPVPAALSGDFVVDEGHRGFGPALALQRALTGTLAECGFACAYGTPNDDSEPVIARAGYAEAARVTRHVKVLRAGHVIERRVPNRALARVASRASVVADPLLRITSRERRRGRHAGLEVVRPALFDERFAAVWEATRRVAGVTPERTAELLNWRYDVDGEGDAGPHGILALADAGGAIAGYAVHRARNGVREIVDVAHVPEPEVLDGLLAEVVREARAAGDSAVYLQHAGASDGLGERLRALGFRPGRETKRLRVYARRDVDHPIDLEDGSNWHFLAGDSDL